MRARAALISRGSAAGSRVYFFFAHGLSCCALAPVSCVLLSRSCAVQLLYCKGYVANLRARNFDFTREAVVVACPRELLGKLA